MAVRTFEEQVRAELGALRLKPDEQVWLHVEAALQKDKKRRWLLWLLVGLVATGALGIYSYQHNATKTEIVTVSGKNEQLQKSSSPEIKSPKENKEPANTPVHVEAGKADQSPSRKYDQKTENNLGSGPVEKTGIAKNILVFPQIPADKKLPATSTAKTVLTPQTDPNRKQEETSAPQIISYPPENREGAGSSAVAVTKTLRTDSILKAGSVQAPDITQKESSTSLIDTAKESTLSLETKSVVVNKKKAPWRLFGTVDLGSSSEVIPPRFGKAGPLYAFTGGYLPGNAIPGMGGSIQYNNGVTYKDPTRSAGFSFGLGLQAVKQIGKHSDISLGLSYQHYKTGITVGRQMKDSLSGVYQSNNNSYYLSSDSTVYHNNWHFAEFTLDYYQRINMGGTTVLRWRLGLGADVLLASNALYFDQSRLVLYEKSAWRNQWQFNLSTGFDLLFGKHQDFYIGPQLTYFLTPSSGGSDYRFLRIALRTGFVIPKRKK